MKDILINKRFLPLTLIVVGFIGGTIISLSVQSAQAGIEVSPNVVTEPAPVENKPENKPAEPAPNVVVQQNTPIESAPVNNPTSIPQTVQLPGQVNTAPSGSNPCR